MFTGIIQNLGKIIDFSNGELEISTSLDLSDCKVGSSICCDGICLTATEINFSKNDNNFHFKVNLGEETQYRTTFSKNLFKKHLYINIEKSLKVGEEISGHFVYGHVDRTTKLLEILNLDNSWEFVFENFKDPDNRYIVDKASIAINGISLTIAKVEDQKFVISVIPHTYTNTNLKFIKKNNLVNVEFDYLARFVKK